MKVLIIVALIATTAFALPSLTELQGEWANYKKNFDKTYESEQENFKRMAIFLKNLKKIEAHNKLYDEGETTYKMGINHFSDWTSEEFMAYVNKSNLEKPNTEYKNSFIYKAPEGFQGPASINWVELGAVSEVKNQGSCGSCYAFSATGVMESQFQITHGQMVLLSEQNIVDCSQDFGNAGCNGGSIPNCYNYVYNNGIDTEQEYPYEAVDGSCRFDDSQSVLKISEVLVVQPGSEASLEAVVGETGPVAVGICVTDNFQQYSSGVFYDPTCQPGARNHAVLVAGYSRQDDQDYWLVKNSWGSGWGEAGYIKMSRKRDNNCDIASDATIPLLE